jgi:hypothetical protein
MKVKLLMTWLALLALYTQTLDICTHYVHRQNDILAYEYYTLNLLYGNLNIIVMIWKL